MSKNRNAVPIGTKHRARLCSKSSPDIPHNRSREPVTRSRMTVRGRFPSKKMGRMIDWESQLERRACYLFEFSRGIKEFREQPEAIQLIMGSRVAKYTPDFELTDYQGGKWIVEIKPLARLDDPTILERLIAASIVYQAQGYQFILITDKELITPSLESNLVLLRNYQTHHLSAELIQHAEHWVRSTSNPVLSNLNEYFESLSTAYALLANFVITTDLSLPIKEVTKLHLPQESGHETCLFSYRTAPDFGVCAVRNT